MPLNFDMSEFEEEEAYNSDEEIFDEEEIQAMEMVNKKIQDMTEEEIEEFRNSQMYEEYKANFREDIDGGYDYNGKNVQQIFGLSDRNSRIGYSYNSVESLMEDVMNYNEIVEKSPIMQETLSTGEELVKTFKYLHQDIFLSLSKYEVNILPESELHYEVLLNRAVMNQLLNTPEYIALRKTCRLDDFNAAVGTEIIGQEAIEMLREILKDIENCSQKKQELDRLIEEEALIDDIVDEIDFLQEQMDDIKDALLNDEVDELTANQELSNLESQMNNQRMSLQEARMRAESIARNCDDLIKDTTDSLAMTTVPTSMTNSIKHAIDEVSFVDGMCESWGLGRGQNIRIDFGSKKRALERIRRSDKLRKMTLSIGRMKESAITEQKKKAKHGAVEIKTTSMGNKIQDTLPSDRMNLCNDTTKNDFYRRMTENSLMIYEKESNKTKNKGPIIICVDTSGSMSGEKEVWSKAMSVAVLEIAQMQKRDFACVLYSSYAEPAIRILKDEIDPDKIIDIATRFSGGGTDFESPLRSAMELIKEDAYKEADILFITDGDCGVRSDFVREFKQAKEEKDFRCLGVIVDTGGHCSDSTLKEFCDTIVNVSSIRDLNDANSNVNTGIFGAL